ncbi:hypothetical protein Tsubulata_029176 [Turnera subulata]|uniref:Rhodanese domain-containing protein n=1 Tax=Turnera subulata TaxID=218843 RepID=A0A9Q0J7X0_9ROSI|nr:hypothetical protein Tsubulata_029176 [Turnera subulata]
MPGIGGRVGSYGWLSGWQCWRRQIWGRRQWWEDLAIERAALTRTFFPVHGNRFSSIQWNVASLGGCGCRRRERKGMEGIVGIVGIVGMEGMIVAMSMFHVVVREFKRPDCLTEKEIDAAGDGDALVILDLRPDESLYEAGAAREELTENDMLSIQGSLCF